ncbi:MAG: ATP-dependent DNA helicase [Solirubrobacteraceae bacterium]|jgi:ATP-dependent DNA helicase RecQ|nr:ATP-dependent DNA helicase [Solirubrobacteraceae bacterium]MDP4673239.1 ATP-dependent DNA helicase [Solirubrobacteraceae bacterium]MDP4921690.1 ATP-dependent DNA helicase [Solirubrobacteraceae bacterium]
MSNPQAALTEIFGFDHFRPGQQEAVAGALAGRDVLLVMPTGAGKSLCYQLPALLRDDLSIVVSPLVSLMLDQVESLERRVGGKVALINAQQDAATNREVLERAKSGELRLLYVAPERFASPGFLEALKETKIGCFVVDEAHCVSQWGHDFRPDYFRLGDAARWLGADSIFASTATATPQVARDIAERLGLNEPVSVATGFDRPNLTFAVAPSKSASHARAQLAAALATPEARPAIVYAGTRKQTAEVASNLSSDLGIKVVAYHAGLDREKRAKIQRSFMDGSVDVVVATNAFGMGVDKADVRTVVHVSVPQSIEAWYQEAGRAGRDGAPARALLLAQNKDKGLHVFFIERSEVDEVELDRVAKRIFASSPDGRYDSEISELGSNPDQVRAIIGHLARAGVLSPSPAPTDRQIGRIDGSYDGRARSLCQTSAKQATKARWAAYRSVWHFVETPTCRRAAVLGHFGDRDRDAAPLVVPCCDVCNPESVADVVSVEVRATKKGASSSGRSLAPRAALGDSSELDDAIIELVASAHPQLGRTRAVQVLRGGRSKVIASNHYDELEHYGAFGDLHADDVLGRVDALLADGRIVSTGGRFPKLQSPAGQGARR